MRTIKQFRRSLIKDYGCVPCEALERAVSKERKIRCEINEAIKRARRHCKRRGTYHDKEERD